MLLCKYHTFFQGHIIDRIVNTCLYSLITHLFFQSSIILLLLCCQDSTEISSVSNIKDPYIVPVSGLIIS